MFLLACPQQPIPLQRCFELWLRLAHLSNQQEQGRGGVRPRLWLAPKALPVDPSTDQPLERLALEAWAASQEVLEVLRAGPSTDQPLEHLALEAWAASLEVLGVLRAGPSVDQRLA